MNIESYITSLRKAHQIRLSFEDDKLRVHTSKKPVDKEVLEGIKARKEALISFLKGVGEGGAAGFEAIPRVAPKSIYRSTSSQRRLYFIHELDKGSVAYHLPRAVRVEGVLDYDRLQGAFVKLIDRHEVLRTCFEVIGSEVFQKVLEEFSFEMEHFEAFEEEVDSLISRFIRPFDLGKGPLLRVGLVKLSSHVHILLLDMHHIISDGFSQGVMIKDFLSLYHDEVLPPLSIQYKDYAEWQYENEKQEGAKGKAFWLDEFSEVPAMLELPTDFPRPSVKNHQGGSVQFELDIDQTAGLQGIARSEGATMFMVLLSIYNILLSKLSGQEDVVIGTPVAGREHPDLEGMIGMFANTLPLRNYPLGDLTFRRFLSAVKAKVLSCFGHQSVQYEDLVSGLNLERDTGHNPLFDVMFAYQDFGGPSLELSGLKVSPYDFSQAVSKFDLTLTVEGVGATVLFNFEYSTGLFKRETVDRFIVYFKGLVSAVIADPGALLGDIDILSSVERHQLLEVFNDTKAYYPAEETIVSLFEQQAQSNPDSPALYYGGDVDSYGTLKSKSDRFAHYLIKERGIGLGDRVGLMLEREGWLLPAIFGILKAGGVYVPIAPDFPLDRIHTIMDDSKLKALVSRGRYCSDIEEGRDLIVDLDHWLPDILSCPSVPPQVNLTSKDLAYVIYTSGSTGKPKGVMIEHHSVVNRVLWMQKSYPIGPTDVLLQKTPVVFDVSVWELFWWSFTGASLCLLKPGGEKEPDELIRTVKGYGVTTMHFVPSMLGGFLSVLGEGFDYGPLQSLRQVFTSGEALTVGHVSLFGDTLHHNCGTRLVNLYGPTEATVDVSYYECNFEELVNPPIGKPIDNTGLYVVDKSGRMLQPVGVAGELYIGGVGVARGYLGREDLTSEKFVPNIFTGEGLVYKTGDLVKWLSDGNLSYLGRMDTQVKVRGYRIELGEIESCLLSHGEVDEVAVVAKEESGGKFLVAYYVSSEAIDPVSLRGHVSVSLPVYMVPSYFVHLSALPLTRNGKLDRKSLPAPEAPLGVEYVPPVSIEEKQLAEVWGDVLGVEKIGVNDNFFSVGGDSIKSIQIGSRMRTLGYEVTVQDIFSHQTIRQLSSNLKGLVCVPDQSPVVGGSPVTPVQRWFFEGVIKDKHHFNQSVMLNFEGGISLGAVRSIFEGLQSHHDALRMVFRVSGVDVYQENKGLGFPLSIVEDDLRGKADQEGLLLSVANELQSGIDLEAGPLMKLGLFHREDGSRLLIVVHHLVIDGVSWRILFEDIETLYRQHREGAPFSLPLKTSPFLSWHSHLQGYLKEKGYQVAKMYWDRFLTKEASRIRRDDETGGHLGLDKGGHTFALSSQETSRLLNEAHRPFGTHVNDLLLAGLLLSVEKYYGLGSFRVDLEGHGREPMKGVDIGRTVGWFTSIYPVLLEKGGEGLSGVVKGVKESLRGVPNRGFDYLLLKYLDRGEIADKVRGGESSQILFNYLGQFDSDTQGRSYRVSREPVGEVVSPNDEMSYDWEVSGMVISGCLEMSIVYSDKQYKAETVGAFMSLYKESLVGLITYCTSLDRKELTPSDLTYKGLSLAQLDELQGLYGIEDIYPLSPMQEGMLFHSLVNVEAGDYFGQTTYQLKGNLDIKAVERSVNELMARYAILRTIFLHEGYARPIQVVLKERKVDFTYVDIRNENPNLSVQESVQAYKEKEKSKTFDLSKDVLMRLVVLQTSEDEFEFIWSHHHVLMDGWCIGIIVNEFIEIYSKTIKNEPVSLPSTKPYATYIEWLENWGKDASEDYWRDCLAAYEAKVTIPQKGALVTGELPYVLKVQEAKMDKEQTKLMDQFSRTYGVTINTLFQCAWGLLLARYNNVNDVVFGSVVSGRPVEIDGVETMIGLFINTIPVRVSYEGDDTVGDVLMKVQDQIVKSGPHHYYPLSEIQSLSELGGELINHIIAFENFPVTEQIVSSEEGVKKEEKPFEIINAGYYVQTNYDLSITIVPSDEFEIRFDYNNNVYEDETITDVISYLKNIILSFVHNYDKPIKDTLLFDQQERSVVEEKLTRDLEIGADMVTIQERLNKSFAKYGENCAIEYKGKSFTYATVASTANKLANVIASHQLPEGSSIGIFCEDRYWVICSMLGILKSRMVFVPLETALPKNRLSSMVEQTGVKFIITDQNPEECKKVSSPIDVSGDAIQWLTIEEADKEGDMLFKEDKDYQLSDQVYVYFTSGSTGNPKGVIGKNKGLSHFIDWEINAFGIDDSFRFSQFTNPGFDVYMRDIFVPLCAGGTICIPEGNILSMDQGIHHWITEQRISLIHCVPSLFKLIQKDGLDTSLFSDLKYVLLAGEKILPYELREWYETFDNKVQLVNIYGPTETTLAKGCYLIRTDDSNRSFIPIKPIPGAQFLILDGGLNVCPKGAVGEIYIRTPYRSAGYLNLEEANRESFIPNPFADNENDVIYKTGDLGRIHENGEIEILGRLDHQVKIRGVRIELDDVKENILKYPGTADAVAVIKEDNEGENYICAYVISEDQLDHAELRNYLEATLPQNMVPSHIIPMPEFPLMPNGKINRKALPEPDIKKGDGHISPSNEVEEKLAEIWSEILKIDKELISIDKSFFEMGGHSIKIFHIINKIQQEYSVKLKLGDIFENPSIQKLALLLAGSGKESFSQIPRAAEKEFYDASPAQERMYYQHLLHQESTAFNISIPIEIKEEVDVDKLNHSFQQLIDRHEGLRTSFTLSNDGVIQKINQDVDFEIEMIDPDKYNDVKEAFNAFIRPFDLSMKSLMRCGLLRNKLGNFLFVDIHHMVSDGSSLELLINDFKKIHLGEPLEPLDVRYVDYAHWLNENKEKLSGQQSYWSNKLSGELTRTDLPIIQERESVDTKLVSYKEIEISGAIYEAIKVFTANHKISDFMFLLSAYYVLLHKMSGNTDMIIGTEVLGRTQPELKDIVGTFVNVLPLRVRVTPESSYTSFMEEVKKCVVEAFDNQDFQFDQMVSMVDKEEDLHRNPIFDFYFSLSNTVDGGAELDELKFVPYNMGKRVKGEYEFTINIIEVNNKMTMSFIYSNELYDDETIELLMHYYYNILADILRDETVKIKNIKMENVLEQAT